MMVLALAISVLFQGLRAILAKNSKDYNPNVWMAAGYTAFPVLAAGLALGLYCTEGIHLQSRVFFWVALNSATAIVALYCLIGAMKKVDATVVISVTAAYPLLTIAFATLIGEPLLTHTICGSILIIGGVIAVKCMPPEQNEDVQSKGMAKNSETNASTSRLTAIAIPLMMATAAAAWAVAAIFQKEALKSSSPEQVMLARSICDSAWVIILAPIIMRKSSTRRQACDSQMWRKALIACICGIVSSAAALVALKHGTTGNVTSIISSYPIVSYVIAVRFFREPITRLRTCGVLLVVAGCIIAGWR
jgi:drug/metabolite transporter (DMT)-like permease